MHTMSRGTTHKTISSLLQSFDKTLNSRSLGDKCLVSLVFFFPFVYSLQLRQLLGVDRREVIDSNGNIT